MVTNYYLLQCTQIEMTVTAKKYCIPFLEIFWLSVFDLDSGRYWEPMVSLVGSRTETSITKRSLSLYKALLVDKRHSRLSAQLWVSVGGRGLYTAEQFCNHSKNPKENNCKFDYLKVFFYFILF